MIVSILFNLIQNSAEIIKVEEPLRGDDTRRWGPPFAQPKIVGNADPESAYFLAVNRNKKSIAVDIKSDRGSRLLQKLAQTCDVVVENYLPGKLDKLGLGYQSLSADNHPGLIYCSITGYGQTGPYSQRPGYDVIIEAEAGFMHITGEAYGEPVKVGVAVTDLMTGHFAHSAILAALLSRHKTGVGQKLDVSLLDSQVASLVNIGSNYLIGGQEATRNGTAHASIVPYQSFKTRNGQIVFGTGNEGQFRKLALVLDCPLLTTDPKYESNQARVKNRKSLIAKITEITLTKTTEEWLEKFAGTGIPNGPVNNIKQTMAHPQVQYRNLIRSLEHPTVGSIKMVGPPVKYSATHTDIRLSPPVLGQHTRQVLSSVATETEIEQLLSDKIIRQNDTIMN